MKRALLVAVAGAFCLHVFVVAQSAPVAAPANALKFFKNFFVTGDYVVGGVGLRGTGGADGLATGQITMPAVPSGVDVLAAFLYWETVQTPNGASGSAGALFNGHPIGAIALALNPAGTAPCWSSGGGTGAPSGAHKLVVYRADVLRFLPIDAATGKHLVTGTQEVKLPDAGSGNSVPSTAGASLVVVYRDPTQPLRAIVIYDGGYTMDQSTQQMSQTIAGFYQAATPAAKMTHIVGDGQPNFSERLLFNGTQLGPLNPFVGALGPAADPAWDNVTFDVTLSGPNEPVTTAVDHGDPAFTPFDCLSWGAIVFSTAVKDTDNDGLLDVWESSSTPILDPNGQPLPNLAAMGADPNVQDIFVQIGYMEAAQATSNPLQPSVPPHTHLPTKAALDLIASALHNAAPRPGIAGPINIHFDVGDNYQPPRVDPDTLQPYPDLPSLQSCRAAATWVPSCAIIPAALARGGAPIAETACVEDPNATPPRTCQFPAFPGTIGWKSGYQFYRDQPLSFPLPPATATQPKSAEEACVAAGPGCRRRFDRNRKDIFHFALFAHALGLARSDVDLPGTAIDERHTPKNTSGIADLVGGDFVVTLGFWDHYAPRPDGSTRWQPGTDFFQASTFMHELGHNLALRHGAVPFEPNCKPNYQSVMNYLFQVGGLRTANAAAPPVVDYSRRALPSLNPNDLNEAPPFQPPTTLPYLTRWYAPAASSFLDKPVSSGGLGTTPATRHCNGSPITESVGWVRVDGTTVDTIDWNANGIVTDVHLQQDITFNGITLPPPAPANLFPTVKGFNDYNLLDLRQIGGRRNVGSRRIAAGGGTGGLSLDVGFGDVGFGDVGFGDVGFGDVGFGDVGFGDVGFGDVGFGDVGFGDVGFGDVGFGDVGAPRGDLDLETATAFGNPPNAFTATLEAKQAVRLRWSPPTVGLVASYEVYRVIGTAVTPSNIGSRVRVGILVAPTPTTPPQTTLLDTTVKTNVTYTYFAIAKFAGPPASQSGASNSGTVLVK